jgi:hypothetical protein
VVSPDGASSGHTYAGVATWDATLVLLRSSAMDLVPNHGWTGEDNFLWSRANGVVSAPTPFGVSRYGPAAPAISQHGRYVIAQVPEFIGGGPLMVHYDRETGRAISLDPMMSLWQMSGDGRIVVYGQSVGGIYVHDLDVPPDGLLPWLDADGDGLPNGWEEATGLDPRATAGSQGATGDADDDGVDNAGELAAGTHPRGGHVQLFAEGVGGTFFDTEFVVANPGASAAHLLLQFDTGRGHAASEWLAVPPLGRRSVNVDAIPGLHGVPMSTRIESDVEVVVERTVRWGPPQWYGAHSETSSRAASGSWYFAEGTTSGPFTLFYLLQNPGAAAVTVTARFLRPFGLPPVLRTYTLPPHSRTTIEVDGADPALASTDVAAHFAADAAIVVERAQYLGPGFVAGHASAGAPAPATSWYLAEGATGPFFELFVPLMNPSPTPASCAVRYLTGSGRSYVRTLTLGGESRRTIWVDVDDIPGVGPVLANEAVSTLVTCSVPVVAERTMWWPDGDWQEAHNSLGVTTTAPRWAVADGRSGGPCQAGLRTFVLVTNTAPRAGSVRVIVRLEDGTAAETSFVLGPDTRSSLDIGQVFPWLGDIRPRRWWALVEGLGADPLPLIVERATYWNADGVTWAAGTSAPGTPVP